MSVSAEKYDDSPDPPVPAKVSLRVQDLAIARNGETLLEEINFTVIGGEMLGLLGPSGSGKSTLLAVICGLIDPRAGVVTLSGRTPAQWGWPAFRRRVALVPQKPVMLDDTLEANLRFPFTFHSAGGSAFPRDRALHLMDLFRLRKEYLQRPARLLSQGEQQRASLIRVLLVEPAVLLLDEPTASLDPENRGFVENLLLDLVREKNLAALLVTHDHEQAERLCDRSLKLVQDDRGRNHFTSTPTTPTSPTPTPTSPTSPASFASDDDAAVEEEK